MSIMASLSFFYVVEEDKMMIVQAAIICFTQM